MVVRILLSSISNMLLIIFVYFCRLCTCSGSSWSHFHPLVKIAFVLRFIIIIKSYKNESVRVINKSIDCTICQIDITIQLWDITVFFRNALSSYPCTEAKSLCFIMFTMVYICTNQNSGLNFLYSPQFNKCVVHINPYFQKIASCHSYSKEYIYDTAVIRVGGIEQVNTWEHLRQSGHSYLV